MPARKRTSAPKWVDPDEIPDLSTPEWQEAIAAGVLRENGKVVRRGRPPSETPKIRTTIRLSPEVVSHFKAGGPGWQGRIDRLLLKEALKKRRAW